MHPTADELSSTQEFAAYRRQRAGKSIPVAHAQHLAGLWPRQREQLETMAKMHDEADREMRRARRRGIAVIDNGRMLPPIVSTSTRPLARRRGAGRPRATASRSSARSGDSGDDGSEPPPPRLALAPKPGAFYSFACLSPEQRGEA